ncbi:MULTISPECIES: hypothetical protein [Aeromonas]|nr:MULTISPECIES: hypothetical protein [Aeromonas]MCJ8216792.1 hypothetical protein [Aeromonas veronii]MCJ8235076.1 hypothetical protein [Aeromonas veronii]MCX0426188.1 hypothetical protein [Aeromonas veronii]MCX0446336.1 hypothetical protein [Aeromonas veronii]MCX7127554.1 hypothetical protein [Aeromonas sp.]
MAFALFVGNLGMSLRSLPALQLGLCLRLCNASKTGLLDLHHDSFDRYGM